MLHPKELLADIVIDDKGIGQSEVDPVFLDTELG